MVYADMHIHTNVSDGSLSPEEIIDIAIAKGISYISITDHNHLGGYWAAKEISKGKQISIIPGIELSTNYKPELHILGYGFDPQNTQLQKYISDKQQYEFSETIRLLRRVVSLFPEIKIKEILQFPRINLLHICRYLASHGYAKNVSEAYAKYVYGNNSIRIQQKELTVQEAIELINSAGGKSVLAHPARIQLEEGNFLSFLLSMKQYGLAGLECYHKSHSKKNILQYLTYADLLGLEITGGSDFHRLTSSRPQDSHKESRLRKLSLLSNNEQQDIYLREIDS